jgi:hypothetical protein
VAGYRQRFRAWLCNGATGCPTNEPPPHSRSRTITPAESGTNLSTPKGGMLGLPAHIWGEHLAQGCCVWRCSDLTWERTQHLWVASPARCQLLLFFAFSRGASGEFICTGFITSVDIRDTIGPTKFHDSQLNGFDYGF